VTRFVLRRLLASVPVLLASTIAVFALVAAGDPLGDLRAKPNVRPETVELRSRQLHLDRPVAARYAIWARGLLRGDLGRSVSGERVGSLLARSAPTTAELVAAAVALALVGTLLLGGVSALRRHSLFDRGGTVVAFIVLSLPVIWVSGILKIAADPVNRAFGRKVLYIVGPRNPLGTDGLAGTVADRAGHLVLPALTLALLLIGEWSRYLRLGMIDELESDYVTAGRAKGLGERGVARHALRNAVVPLTPVVSLGLARLIGGAIITERVFQWQGMGSVLITGLQDQDVYVVMGWLIIAAAAVVVCNLAADVAGALLDPRTRRD